MRNVLVLLFFVSTDGKYVETKSSHEKSLWSNVMIDQLIDINCSDHLWKKNSEIKNSLPKQIFLKRQLIRWMRQLLTSKDILAEVSFSQARSKFKKLVSECIFVSLTERNASGKSRYQVEKGYGKRWDWLFPLAASRVSSDHNNNIETL